MVKLVSFLLFGCSNKLSWTFLPSHVVLLTPEVADQPLWQSSRHSMREFWPPKSFKSRLFYYIKIQWIKHIASIIPSYHRRALLLWQLVSLVSRIYPFSTGKYGGNCIQALCNQCPPVYHEPHLKEQEQCRNKCAGWLNWISLVYRLVQKLLAFRPRTTSVYPWASQQSSSGGIDRGLNLALRDSLGASSRPAKRGRLQKIEAESSSQMRTTCGCLRHKSRPKSAKRNNYNIFHRGQL